MSKGNIKQQMEASRIAKGQAEKFQAVRGWPGLTDKEFARLQALPVGERTVTERKLVRREQLRRNNIVWRANKQKGKAGHKAIYMGKPTAYAKEHKPFLSKAQKRIQELKKEGALYDGPHVKDYLPIGSTGPKKAASPKKAKVQAKATKAAVKKVSNVVKALKAKSASKPRNVIKADLPHHTEDALPNGHATAGNAAEAVA